MAYIQFQLRRGTAAEWSSANPVLAVAEMGVETDTKKFKIGDGTTAWNSLAYGGLSGMSGFSGASGFSGYSGSAGGASLTNDTTTNSDAYYPAMSYNSTSGTWTSAYVSSKNYISILLQALLTRQTSIRYQTLTLRKM